MLVRLADFAADHGAIRRIRFAVFVDEQHVPASLEMDERDPQCVHVLAIADGEPIGTGRIDLTHSGKIGRVAVLAAYRGMSVGTALMERLHDVAHTAGLGRVWCNAQATAVPFYARLGYRTTGNPFQEAGIEHIEMERFL